MQLNIICTHIFMSYLQWTFEVFWRLKIVLEIRMYYHNNCNLPGISTFTIDELQCLFIWTWLLTTVWNCPSSPGPTWCGAIPTLWTSDTAPGTTTPTGILYSGFNPPLNLLRPSYRIPSIGNICPMILRVYCSSSLLIMVCCFNICEI